MSQMTTTEAALKQAIYQTVRRNGGVESAGSLVGLSSKTMSRYQSNEHPKCSPSIFTAFQLDECGGDHILQTWARERGFKLVNRNAKGRVKSLSKTLAKISKEHGDVMRVGLEANADLEFTPTEATQLLPQIEDEIEALRELKSLCIATIQGEDQ
ncbi:MAG: hypothetical protein COB93_02445 [Sneathiella sp.]|nr:MAG: hypothetical protein COB93_02445 [Sneathiella sp.]